MRPVARILLLGSGELGREFTIAAKRLGAYVIACDSYERAPAMQVADDYEVLSMLDGEALAAVIEKHRPDHIVVDYIEGPLKYLKNEWRFEAAPEGGTNVFFSVDFAFKSRIFEALAGQMFDRALRRMTGAFETRAAELYGINRSSAQSAA